MEFPAGWIPTQAPNAGAVFNPTGERGLAPRALRPLLCLLLVLLCGRATAAEQLVAGFAETYPARLRSRPTGPEDELSSMGITALARDEEGFLWVGSDLGLYRFDGHRFLEHRAQAGPADRSGFTPLGGPAQKSGAARSPVPVSGDRSQGPTRLWSERSSQGPGLLRRVGRRGSHVGRDGRLRPLPANPPPEGQ